jgi:hypothetical protein
VRESRDCCGASRRKDLCVYSGGLPGTRRRSYLTTKLLLVRSPLLEVSPISVNLMFASPTGSSVLPLGFVTSFFARSRYTAERSRSITGCLVNQHSGDDGLGPSSKPDVRVPHKLGSCNLKGKCL